MEVRNSCGKLVCRVDPTRKAIEIVIKGYKTIVSFCENGTVKIINSKKDN